MSMEVARDFEEFFASCNRQGVQYLLVRGFAFAFHARPRYTGTMDLFLRASRESAEALIRAPADLGFELEDLSWKDFDREEKIVQLGHPPVRIDIITTVDGVDFDDAWPRRVEADYGNQKVCFISKADLIANKRASGRRQDLTDLESLLQALPLCKPIQLSEPVCHDIQSRQLLRLAVSPLEQEALSVR